ncbi:zeta-carotene desaturase, chloroplastic/chromoplastic-like [Magnolia sinica]|uniref:zeta-carotene desaturase, chloroplastic/chromoplastic-like n=1 Tax=Magnolia sinica TaxID=86752 RepID=UPI00265B3C66|nr:zeta-carotene desaturase, chloroplastic/chromoplastic-like [Magnolia sinica]
MSTAVELLDQGHEVDIYDSRSFIGGKVGSCVDKHGNHIEMGLHVFFGCYSNLFCLMKKKNSVVAGALIGVALVLTCEDASHEQVIHCPITGVALSTAVNLLVGIF